MSVWLGPLYPELPILLCSGFSGGCSHGSVKSRLLMPILCGAARDLRPRGQLNGVWCDSGPFKWGSSGYLVEYLHPFPILHKRNEALSPLLYHNRSHSLYLFNLIAKISTPIAKGILKHWISHLNNYAYKNWKIVWWVLTIEPMFQK